MNRFLPLLALVLAPAGSAADFDMSKPPAIAPMRAVKLPPRTEWMLANGLDVVLVADRRLPMVTAILTAPGGQAALPAEDAGLAEAMGELLTDGTATKTSREIADAAELFGGSISGGAGMDAMTVEARRSPIRPTRCSPYWLRSCVRRRSRTPKWRSAART